MICVVATKISKIQLIIQPVSIIYLEYTLWQTKLKYMMMMNIICSFSVVFY